MTQIQRKQTKSNRHKFNSAHAQLLKTSTDLVVDQRCRSTLQLQCHKQVKDENQCNNIVTLYNSHNLLDIL